MAGSFVEQRKGHRKAKITAFILDYTNSRRIIKKSVENYNLGKGETEALSLALEIPESGVILDDFAARKCARNLHIPFIGTGGLLISAKQRKLISSVSEALEKIQREGLWLSDAVVKTLKEKAKE